MAGERRGEAGRTGASALEDREVDRLYADGGDGALSELHRHYSRRLEQVAFRIVGNQADAEDVVQRVFLALPRASWRGQASLWTYLYRAASNGAINVLRARRRRARFEQQALLGCASAPLAEPVPSPDENVLEAEVFSAVARALLHVRPRHRRALVLRIAWGLTNAEIARREKVPPATVATWLRRGREELRLALGPLARDVDPERAR